jgi:hypothetical protein
VRSIARSSSARDRSRRRFAAAENIGRLFRTRFKGSQFIVVSLKDGLFSNANGQWSLFALKGLLADTPRMQFSSARGSGTVQVLSSGRASGQLQVSTTKRTPVLALEAQARRASHDRVVRDESRWRHSDQSGSRLLSFFRSLYSPRSMLSLATPGC